MRVINDYFYSPENLTQKISKPNEKRLKRAKTLDKNISTSTNNITFLLDTIIHLKLCQNTDKIKILRQGLTILSQEEL